jgi:hypothetical protein
MGVLIAHGVSPAKFFEMLVHAYRPLTVQEETIVTLAALITAS